ncbi:hypothetical protein [Campylobacter lanienae]|uniref:hypothetical protein n=1 Tax=Campylobacter lanienae TaxID=75658 RepID=UPI00242A57BB|nr:hypothetical protein [Campylobacter lanienae]MDD5786015.1 hypothetical protein [Campylobacter lanienae]
MTIIFNKDNIIDYTFNELFIAYNGVIIVIDKKQVIEFDIDFIKVAFDNFVKILREK